jgi:hypothetical protein
MAKFLELLLAAPDVKPLLSSEHFSVEGTLLQAWASHSSLERIDGSDDDPPPPSSGRLRQGRIQGSNQQCQAQKGAGMTLIVAKIRLFAPTPIDSCTSQKDETAAQKGARQRLSREEPWHQAGRYMAGNRAPIESSLKINLAKICRYTPGAGDERRQTHFPATLGDRGPLRWRSSHGRPDCLCPVLSGLCVPAEHPSAGRCHLRCALSRGDEQPLGRTVSGGDLESA